MTDAEHAELTQAVLDRTAEMGLAFEAIRADLDTSDKPKADALYLIQGWVGSLMFVSVFNNPSIPHAVKLDMLNAEWCKEQVRQHCTKAGKPIPLWAQAQA